MTALVSAARPVLTDTERHAISLACTCPDKPPRGQADPMRGHRCTQKIMRCAEAIARWAEIMRARTAP